MTYLVSAYASDDSLYPKDVRIRAMVDQRLQFDLGTLYARMIDYFVILNEFTMKIIILKYNQTFKFPTLMMGAALDSMKKARLDEALGWFDTMLKGRTWCAANDITVADISLVVTVSQIEGACKYIVMQLN